MHSVKLLAALSLSLVSLYGCEPVPSRFASMPIERPVVELHYHEFKTLSELQSVIGNRTGKAVWSPNDNRCDIYFVAGDFETIGHEAYHCFKGSFHEETYRE
jgi:hypothetical protein